MDNEHAILTADNRVGEAAVNAPPDSSSSSSSVSPASEFTSESVSDNTNSAKKLTTTLFDDDDGEDVCRICRNPGDADNPLRYPCACSGSIKFVHQDCLLQWLNHSNARRCEVCKRSFLFSPVYAENAPAKLHFREIVVGMSMKGYNGLQFLLRLTFVLSIWFVILPFITFWIWRFSFVRSFGEAQRLFLNHMSTTTILTDCLNGFLLSVSIVLIFVLAAALMDYFRHLREVEGEIDGVRNGARVARRQPAQANINLVDEGNDADAGGIVGAGQLIRNAAPLEAHVEQMFAGLDDGEGAEDPPFNELVGMQGPLFHLVRNALIVLACNLIFLGVMILVPFHLGRFVQYHLSWFLSSATGPMVSTVVPLTEKTLSLANITLMNALTVVANLTSDHYPDNSVIGEVAEILKANAAEHVKSSNNATTVLLADILETSWVSDVSTLAAGYMFILSLVVFYFGTAAVIRCAKGEPLIVGRLYGIASIAETISSLFKHFLTAMKHLTTMIKVAFLLVVEFGVFPMMCGWWLDICTVRMFGKSIAQRVEFFSVSPLESSFIHWVVGIVYMLHMFIFVYLLRGVLRNGVLYFLRDPADPNYDPIQNLIDDPVHKHAHSILLSVASYGSLIVMLVYLPVKLAMQMAPSLFPLDISVSELLTGGIPTNMLVFQVFIPFAVEHLQFNAAIKSLLHNWLTAVGWALGLTDFLLPRPEDNGGQEIGNQDPARHYRGINRRKHAETNVNLPEENIVEQSDTGRYEFVLSILLLLLAAWMTLLIFNSMLILVPISLGRAFFNVVPFFPVTHDIKCNDLYAFIIGIFIIPTILAGATYFIDQIKTKRATVLVVQIWRWCSIAVKSSVLLSIWIFMIPVMIGLLFKLLVIVPLRVPVDESPVFFLYQDWAFGLLFLKLWIQLVMLGQMAPLGYDSWRAKFERVRENGFRRLEGGWVLREIVIPIVMKLLTALCFPYVIAKGVFPVFGYPLVVNSAVYRFAWVGWAGLSLLWYGGKRFHGWVTNLHNTIRDDRYLIGRRLHNFGEGGDGEDVILRNRRRIPLD